MAVHSFDPLRDPRWEALLRTHPAASVFHTPGWLRTLHRCYGYEPVGFTTSPAGGPLTQGIVFCQVESWLTGATTGLPAYVLPFVAPRVTPVPS